MAERLDPDALAWHVSDDELTAEARSAYEALYAQGEDARAAGLPPLAALQAVKDGYSSAAADEALRLDDPAETRSLGPFVRDSDTSRKAALDAYPRQGSQRARIIGSLSYAGDATRDELMLRTGLGHSSVGPRVKELIEGGWVQETDHTRKTSRGSEAVLLTLTYKAREELGRQRHAEGL